MKAVNYSRYYVQRILTSEARWRTSASIKLQNSIETASTMSAIQYPADPLFLLLETFEKDDEKSVLSMFCRFHRCFRSFSADNGQKRIKNNAFSSKKALVQSGGKVLKC